MTYLSYIILLMCVNVLPIIKMGVFLSGSLFRNPRKFNCTRIRTSFLLLCYFVYGGVIAILAIGINDVHNLPRLVVILPVLFFGGTVLGFVIGAYPKPYEENRFSTSFLFGVLVLLSCASVILSISAYSRVAQLKTNYVNVVEKKTKKYSQLTKVEQKDLELAVKIETELEDIKEDNRKQRLAEKQKQKEQEEKLEEKVKHKLDVGE